jgi:hypothetical protein
MSIDFTEYDRITDTLMWLADNITLNFTVGLSKKAKSGERAFYHYETRYGSDKYGSPLRSIKRQMNFAFTIDCKDNFLAGLMLRPQDVELLTRLIELKVLPWFLDTGKKNAYKIIDDKIILKDFEPVTFIQDNRWLSFQPGIYVDPYTQLESRGIRMELYSGFYWTMPVDKFMGFFHIISKTDMYNVACSMCNYTKMEPYGINVYTATGLGANSTTNTKIDEAWNNSAPNKSLGANSFLNGAKSKD